MKFQPKIYHYLFLLTLFFMACEDEAVQLNIPDAVEVITANTALSNLMLRTSANETSDDDILDNTSCFSIELPVMITVGNITITIENEDGFDELEELLEEFEGEIPEFIFPITIVSADYSETVIENQAQLQAIIENCIEDNSIECVDFVYPISFSELNIDFVIVNTVTINSNNELYAYLENLDNDDTNLVALNFPVTLQFANGETLEVNSNVELSDAISSVDDDCDIDDSENCDADQIRQSLKECVWHLDDEFNDFDDLTAIFNDDFTLEINGPDLNEPITGVWEIIDNPDNDGVYLVISELSALSGDLAGDWLIIECDDDELTIIKNDFILELNKDCNETDCTEAQVEAYLQTCIWNAVDVSGNENLVEYDLDFQEETTLIITSPNTETIEATYAVLTLADGVYLSIENVNAPNIQAINGYYKLFECDENRLKFTDENSDGYIILEQDCEVSPSAFDCFANQVFELIECANDAEEAEFNLILGTVNTVDCDAEYTATFHNSQADAENNVAAISNSESYLTTSVQVYLRIAVANGDFQVYNVFLNAIECNPFECFESFDAVLEQCGENNDGIEVFNLPIAFDNCTPTADVVTYHNTLADAEAATNPIANPQAYTSDSPTETIYVRVEIENQVEIFELLIKIVDCQQSGCSFDSFLANLQECEWKITSYAGDESFNIFTISFMNDNSLVINGENESYTGNWTASLDGFIFMELSNISGGNVQIFNGINFKLVECADNQLIFHDNNDSSNELVLDRICE